MIVMLNTLEDPAARQCARSLAARLEAGRVLDLWTEPRANVERRISDLRSQGCQHLVAPGTFFTRDDLTTLRRSLGLLDDEVYAYVLDLWGDNGPAGLGTWRAAVRQEARQGDMGFDLGLAGQAAEAAAAALWQDLHEPVELVEADPRWPRQFGAERRRILEAAATQPEVPGALSVEHVGSTAVPGLLAKPIIDILITVASLEAATAWIAPLAGLGYAFIDYPQNRDRRFFRKGKPRTHHIQVVQQQSPAARAYLAFRDALRADESLRQEYATLKRASQRELKHKRALYGERKTALIRRALAAARGE